MLQACELRFLCALGRIRTCNLLIRTPVISGADRSVNAHLVLIASPAPSGWCAHMLAAADGSVSKSVSSLGPKEDKLVHVVALVRCQTRSTEIRQALMGSARRKDLIYQLVPRVVRCEHLSH